MKAHYRVPPDWSEEAPKEGGEGGEGGAAELVVSETSFSEPDCMEGWCGLVDTIVWERPEGLEYGQVLSGDGKVRSLGLLDDFGGEDEEL